MPSNPWGDTLGSAAPHNPWGDSLGAAQSYAPVSSSAAPSPTPRSAKPRKSSAIEAFSDITDVPLNLGASLIDPLGKHKLRGDFPEAWHTLMTQGPHALQEQYSPTSQAQLQRHAAKGDWAAQAQLKYPAVRAAAGFGEEFLNPSNAALGPLIGGGAKLLGAGAKAIPGVADVGSKIADKLAPELDRFYGMRKVAGLEGESLGRNMLDAQKKQSGEALQKTLDVFGPVKRAGTGPLTKLQDVLSPQYLTPEEKIEVVRRSTQGLKPNENVIVKGKGNVDRLSGIPSAELTARGKAYRAALKQLDWEQINAHPDLLAENRIFNPETFVPMAGQYRNPKYTDETAQFLEDFRPLAAAGSLKTIKGTARQGGPHKTNLTIDEALQRPELLRPDFDPAAALFSHLSRRGRNVAFEKAIQAAPESLAKRIEYETPLGPLGGGQRLNINQFQHWGPQAEEQFAKAVEKAGAKPIIPPGHVHSEDVQKMLGSSPSAKQRTFDPEFVKFITRNGAQPQDATGIASWLGTINNLTRVGIITNPVVHVGWNLFGNYLGAGGDPAKLAYVASGKGWDDAAKWEKLAEEHGAHVHFKPTGISGGEPARLFTGGGNPIERVSSRMWDANQKLVFDTFEKRFATALFRDKVAEAERAGMQGVDAMRHAGIQVRKALGDYANVNPDGLEGTLNRAMFFYPWLKTVVPFWAKTAMERPQAINAPLRGLQDWNQGMGDPNASGSPTSLYLGKQGGKERYFSLPLPMRNFASVLESAAPGGTPGAGMSEHLKPLLDLGRNHLTPPLGLLEDVFQTGLETPKEPGGGNFHTLWDKAAPPGVQFRQGLEHAVGRFSPPFVAGSMQALPDLEKGNLDAALGALGGSAYARETPEKERLLAGLRARIVRAIMQARAFGHPELADRIYDQYQKILTGIEK